MKLKKLFAGVVAAAMMFTMAVPAFAAPKENNLELDDNKYIIQKGYALVGEGTSPAGTFNFEIGNGKKNNTSAETIPTPTMTPSVAYVAGDATAKSSDERSVKNITIDFAPGGNLIYTSVGKYTYTIKETVPKESEKILGVGYDEDPITMAVYVVNVLNEQGEPTGELKISEISLTKNGHKITGKVDGDTNENAAFLNTYTANKLNVKKTVNGDAADKNVPFNFNVSFTNESGKVWSNAIVVKKGDETQTITPNSNGVYSISLKHGESLDFTNIPAGLKYNVDEMNANSAMDDGDKITVNETEYTVSYDNVKAGQMESGALATVVKNTAKGFIDTGVILDNAPYMLMLAVVAAGAMTLVIKKRREEE